AGPSDLGKNLTVCSETKSTLPGSVCVRSSAEAAPRAGFPGEPEAPADLANTQPEGLTWEHYRKPTLERQAHATVDHAPIERRPGIDGPTSVRGLKRADQRIE